MKEKVVICLTQEAIKSIKNTNRGDKLEIDRCQRHQRHHLQEWLQITTLTMKVQI